MAGLEFIYHLNKKIKIGTKSYIVNYSNTSGSVFPFDKGFAFYPGFYSKIYNVELYSGFWYGNGYIGPRGEDLFSSYSVLTGNSDELRKLLNFKIGYQKYLQQGILFGVNFEIYKDLDISDIDYSYSIYLRFNRDFKLRDLNK